jgi:hypothetical protein
MDVFILRFYLFICNAWYEIYIATFWDTGVYKHRNAHSDKTVDNCARAEYSILRILVHLMQKSLYMQNNNV